MLKIDYPLLYKPFELVKKYNCPILKRRTFYTNNWLSDKYNTKTSIIEVIKWLKTNQCYDIELIYQDINRTNKKNNMPSVI